MYIEYVAGDDSLSPKPSSLPLKSRHPFAPHHRWLFSRATKTLDAQMAASVGYLSFFHAHATLLKHAIMQTCCFSRGVARHR
jgi:hypothetical protein